MLSISVEGLDALQTRLGAYPAALTDRLTEKARALADSLVEKVKFEKLAGEALNAGTGALSASIAAEISSDSENISAAVGSYGDVKYAAIQEYGGRTGAHEILPDKAQALAFLAGGAMHFARRVEHPGSVIPERSYLRSSLEEMAPDIESALSATAGEVWENA